MGEKDFSDRAFVGDDSLSYVSRDVFRAVRDGVSDPIARAELIADLCRINTLFMIMQAGSGHIGSSFSSTDIITWLWTEYLRDPNGTSKDADIYFSSKGHDAPALYSLLIAMEKLPFELLPKLRQRNGLPGHPDVSTPYIATNTGSLGMGISKAYGMARANRYTGRNGRIVVMASCRKARSGNRCSRSRTRSFPTSP
jgi:transketolase